MGVLERILQAKREEIAALKAVELPEPPPLRRFSLERKTGDPLWLIAEIKLRSPSAGALSTRLSVTERAHSYEKAGANMLSVLCDRSFFDGSYEHLAQAKNGSNLPVLCKEFVLDKAQIRLARAWGADAILIIVRCLTPQHVSSLAEDARAQGLEPLLEVTNEEEARVALDAGTRIIGVNARDLDTLEIDLERATRVLKWLEGRSVRVHLSGLGSPADVARVAATGVDAALVGEALMREDDPGPLLQKMAVMARTTPRAVLFP
ncbi:MAG TPA: indole-3-glycerol phosphate synthase TrpC [Polyangiaceae bacterium]|jgi:indole-3-glycerol phosphate synthase